jgi:aspartyl-tRNA synthetase
MGWTNPTPASAWNCATSPISSRSRGSKSLPPCRKERGPVKALNAKGCIDFSRKEIDDLTEFVAIYQAKGLAWIKVREDGWQSPIAKFFTDEEKAALTERIDMAPGDLVFFVADQPKVTNEALGHLRNLLGEKLGMVDPSELNFAWVTHFPMLEYDETEKRYQALHHPFTAPLEEDYDQCWPPTRWPCGPGPTTWSSTGYEIGGGSIRIHDRRDVQAAVSSTALRAGPPKATRNKFGFLLEALQSGAPPHGGIAFGFDRLVMLMCQVRAPSATSSPFPRPRRPACLLTNAPFRGRQGAAGRAFPADQSGGPAG